MEEELRLSETELRYFGDLFLCCDVEKTGKISTLKATELFRSANLSNDVVKQIMSLVGIPQTSSHLSRKQFYSCLKLIAAHQASIQLRQEMITANLPGVPLPRFSWKDSPTPISGGSLSSSTGGVSTSSTVTISTSSTASILNSVGEGHRTPETTDAQTDGGSSDVVNSDQPSTDSEVEQNEPQQRHVRGSPENWSTASDSPTPTNSAAERPWVKDTLWQGLLCEEQRQLLGTEEESSDRHSSDDDNDIDLETVYQITAEQKEYYIKQFRAVQPDVNGLLAGHVARVFFEKSRIPIEELRHIWQLCDVTRDNALSLGEFTAAMHLVVLRRNNIPLPTQLPPCLLQAIHGSGTTVAVVPEKTDPPEADLLNLGDDVSSSGIVRNPVLTSQVSNKISPTTSIISSNNTISSTTTTALNASATDRLSPPPPPQNQQSSQQNDKEWSTASKQWTKFPESPTSSSVSSPGPKPVNFDMQRTAQAVVSDPQILHPVPLRVTPVGGMSTPSGQISAGGSVVLPPSSMTSSLTGGDSIEEHFAVTTRTKTTTNNENNLVFSAELGSRDTNDSSSPKQVVQLNSSSTAGGSTHPHRDSLQNDIRPIQRPQPKKLLTQKNIGALPPPPQRETSVTSSNSNESNGGGGSGGSNEIGLNNSGIQGKKDPPPLPPPRPHRHARSSSLDLNKLKLNTPPEIPPRVSPQTSVDVHMDVENPSFADFAQFSEAEFIDANNSIQCQQPRPTIPSIQSNQRTSAFEVYRKPGHQNSQSPNNLDAIQSTLSLRTSEYEKRVSTITDNLKHVTFKQDKNLTEILKHLKEQNYLLLKLCNDLSDELVMVQQRKEEIRTRLDHHTHHFHNQHGPSDTVV